MSALFFHVPTRSPTSLGGTTRSRYERSQEDCAGGMADVKIIEKKVDRRTLLTVECLLIAKTISPGIFRKSVRMEKNYIIRAHTHSHTDSTIDV